MSDWRSHIQKFHDLDYADSPGSLVLGPPATEQAILTLEKKLGVTFPGDFRSFYLTYDGFGTASEDGTDWFFLPLASIEEHTTDVREEFANTHPALAAAFVSFADWGDGDASGYLFDSDGKAHPAIHLFEHESYEAEPGQAPETFLLALDDSIEDFLTS